jgi:hypothetical protein
VTLEVEARKVVGDSAGVERARAGIDPYNLLDWEEGDNIEPVKIDALSAKGPS